MKISKKQLRKIIREELRNGGRPEMNRRNSTSWRGWVGGDVTESHCDEAEEVEDDERSAMGGDAAIASESRDLDMFVKMVLSERAIRYAEGGLGDPNKLKTGQVSFNWGTYKGRHADEHYFIQDGRSELGGVQAQGDPYTYEWSLPDLSPQFSRNKLRVVSAPDSGKGAIGSLLSREQSLEASGEQPGSDEQEGAAVADQGGSEAGPQSARVAPQETEAGVSEECSRDFYLHPAWTTDRIMEMLKAMPVRTYVRKFGAATHYGVGESQFGYTLWSTKLTSEPAWDPTRSGHDGSINSCLNRGCLFGSFNEIGFQNEIDPTEGTVQELIDSRWINYWNPRWNPNIRPVFYAGASDPELGGVPQTPAPFSQERWDNRVRWDYWPFRSFPGPELTIEELLGLDTMRSFLDTGVLQFSDGAGIEYPCGGLEARWRILDEFNISADRKREGT